MSGNERTWPPAADISGVDAAGAARGRWRFGMLALITIVLALSSGDRAALSVAGTDMGRELRITTIEIGYLFSAFSWAYVLFMIPSGWLADRIGSKKSMFWAVAIWSAFTVCMGLVEFVGVIFPLLLALRFLLGVAESPVGPASTRVIASWFPSSERGIAGAIFNSAQYFSLAVFTPFMGWVCYALGWQYVFIAMGCVGFVIAALWSRYYFLPTDHPRLTETELSYIRDGGGLVDLRSRSRARTGEAQRSQIAEIGLLFRSRMLLGMFLGQYCVSAITWFYVTWFPIYLVKQRGFDILQAGFVSSIPALCGLIGAIASGFASDALLRRSGSLTVARKTPIVTGVLLSSSMILCNYIDTPWIVVAVMSLAFFGKGFGNLGFSVVADTAPREMVGVTGAVFNALGNVAGIVTPVIIGYLLHASGSFNSALLYVGAHGLIAAFAYLFIVPTIHRLSLDELSR
ncbi:TPA: MFS transporter [Burkholderia cenocepacia]|uniref:MFS transporter n=1 Tax=Burkholderia latens TaxID=488446 RepID=A0A6H9TI43_9BURK|nr:MULTISPECIES: MFS transporter [Burkholderia]KAB0644677.1 MFS transporter [Burkholderia latens]MBJ9922829.1 MFS transporter [Burkholderia cenocepacia]VWB22555.1 major facilitator superfamily transporter phthalate permease [Burkholderia latens]HDR9879839.1 MFS transporter [Burkholderia cenocepacia]HDR9886928.1 MFS transporter [Burkholderia cenocepacia]